MNEHKEKCAMLQFHGLPRLEEIHTADTLFMFFLSPIVQIRPTAAGGCQEDITHSKFWQCQQGNGNMRGPHY